MASIISFVGFVAATFWLYRVLIQAKEAQISLLKEQVAQRDTRIKQLENQSPDALLDSLSKRLRIATDEIVKLAEDGEKYSSEIKKKRAELAETQAKLISLTELMRESGLVCGTCGAPLIRKESRTVVGHFGDREFDADVEYREYQCGRTEDEGGGECKPCPHIGT